MNMSMDLKNDRLPKLRQRYQARKREGKTRMLDELCQDHGYERKYAIKLLGDTVPAPSGRAHPGPEPRYALIEPVVRAIWLAAAQPCGKRLAPALPLWLRHYENHHGALSARQRQRLAEISPATLDRLLAAARAQHHRRGRSGTKPGRLLKDRDPHPHRHLGPQPARLPGSRQRGPLRRQPGRRLHLEPHLHGHRQPVDCGPGRVE